MSHHHYMYNIYFPCMHSWLLQIFMNGVQEFLFLATSLLAFFFPALFLLFHSMFSRFVLQLIYHLPRNFEIYKTRNSFPIILDEETILNYVTIPSQYSNAVHSYVPGQKSYLLVQHCRYIWPLLHHSSLVKSHRLL